LGISRRTEIEEKECPAQFRYILIQFQSRAPKNKEKIPKIAGEEKTKGRLH
jgi:hypothetical protein